MDENSHIGEVNLDLDEIDKHEVNLEEIFRRLKFLKRPDNALPTINSIDSASIMKVVSPAVAFIGLKH
ncbi:hypothetical protein AYI68_g6633 [Smittium mucronatum]|uniref:Uncharacterized protein n=1 Tax=Smittium mucronatum TaxID=133383 RepID=A0A1R0GQZ6_9FUNG|nr:hypothetical protein AYI68_g6633 [Smittium mucronatum]